MKSMMLLLVGSLFATTVLASKGGTVADEIMANHNSSKHFHQFIHKMTKNVIPGDRKYIWKLINSSKDLRNSYEMPKLTYENGLFTVRDGKSEATLLFIDREHYEFEINGEKIKLSPSFEPSTRWKKLSSLVAAQPKQSMHFSLLPIAWAQEAGLPTKTAATLFAISSRMAKYSSSVMSVRVGEVTYMDLLNVALKSKGKCDKEMLVEYGQKVAALNPQELQCDRRQGMVSFKFSGAEGYERVLHIVPADRFVDEDEVHEEILDGGKKIKIKYRRSTEIPHEDETGYEDLSVAEKGSPYQRDLAGAEGRPWLPTASKDSLAVERGEQFKELANYALKHDLCGRCEEVLRGFLTAREKASKKPISVPVSDAPQSSTK